jgi:signal transduction histidine kinase/CheY-like chemotaxis protein
LKNLYVSTVFFLVVFLAFLPAPAIANDSHSYWLDSQAQSWQALQAELKSDFSVQTSLPLTGGTFWHVLSVDEAQAFKAVIDFESTSVIGEFSHFVLDASENLVMTLNGGIQSKESNPYFLRHGRDVDLPAGEYLIITKLTSPFLLAQPKPSLYEPMEYRSSIKVGNTLTLLGLGVFLALGVYYIVLGLMRRQRTDYLYAVFILCNLIYNATALNVFSDVSGLTVFYSIGLPIMLSNIAYVAFVMSLLGINKQRHPYLFRTGQVAIGVMATFWLIVPFNLQMSLEFARYGVGIFALYGFTSGILLTIQGSKIARYYLIANIAFIIPALLSILLQSVSAGTMFIEHLGLFAVAVEVILLSLVLSYQLSMVYKEKSASLIATENALITAESAVKAKERFIANVSHELRTPLNAIQGSIELLNQNPKAEDQREHLQVIEHSSSFLLFLINDILDLAKLNANMLTLEKTPVQLRTLLSDISKIYSQPFAHSQSCDFALNIDDNIPESVMCDEKRLEQVLANLLSNAFKFTEQGEVTLNVQLETDDRIAFSVSDTGIGIANEDLASMFIAFTQADSSTSRKFGGTGLGLSIASKITSLMGGNLEAHSVVGEGSTFHFSLPLELPEPEALSTLNPNSESESNVRFAGKTAWVIDDNLVNLKVATGLLETLGCSTQFYSDARPAIEEVKSTNHYPDIIIMDVQMPEIDGLMATREIRKLGLDQPIIGFTANSSEDDLHQCLKAGMNDILVKPVTRKKLSDMLGKWLI